jgi:ResB-like family
MPVPFHPTENVIMFKNILSIFASLRVTVIGLILLLILTIWGTLFQANNGLFLAQEKFYRSWFFLIGGMVPFPGAQSVMVILFINLGAAILQLGLRGKLKWGMLITHIGLLMMLSAGAVTFYLGHETQLTLEEGEGSNVAISYEDWELAVIEPTPGHNHSRKVHAIDAHRLKPGRSIGFPASPYSIKVEKYFRNSTAVQDSDGEGLRSSSGFTGLRSRAISKEPAQNTPGVIFTLLMDGEEQGRYMLWGNDPRATVLEHGDTSYLMGLRRTRLPLPALIQLIDFRREMHPGSNIAKSYSSQVLVKTSEDSDRKVLISMNKPLRLDAFTFYQSSFSSSPGGREVSTFSVVLNYGRLMPYIATGLTVVGMLFHFTGMLIFRLRRQHNKEQTT